MVRFDASCLPPDTPADAVHIIAGADDDVQVTAPILDARAIHHVCKQLRSAQARLATMPVERVIRAIDNAARALRDPVERERVAVLRSLVSVSGFSAPMAEHLLDRAAQDWTADALNELLELELGGAAAIESFVEIAPGRRTRAIAPPLGLHIFSGNVPGVGVTSIVRALLVRSAVLGKSAAAEPSLAPAFARLLARADPAVGAAVAVTWWQGGDAALEAAALEHVDLVVHYGSEHAIASLRARAPARVTVIEHGPRISFAVIAAASASAPDTAANLARAVALFDQQGCVSPHMAWVIGTAADARTLAKATADALARLQIELPRGPITAEEAAAIRDARDRAEFRAIAGHDADAWGPDQLQFSVILSDDPALQGSCLNRTIIITHVPDSDTLIQHVAPAGSLLQSVGVAGFDHDQLLDLASALARIGATRITPLDRLPWPPPSWHHDGRGPLRELVRWVDLETSVTD